MKFLRILIPVIAAMIFAACSSSTYKKFATADIEWSLVLEQDSAPFASTVINSTDAGEPVVSQKGKDIVISFAKVTGKDIDLSFKFSPYAKGKGVEITSTVTNNEPGVYVKAVVGPILEAQGVDLASWDLFVPWGPGIRYSGRPDSVEGAKVGQWMNMGEGKYEITASYPTTDCHMDYIEFNDGKQGLYLASHDPDKRFKDILVRFDANTGIVRCGIKNMMTCFTGQTVTNPGTIVYPHDGDWHVGADLYSEYYHANNEILVKPAWVNDCTAWMLTIMKQQNGELMWPYSTIGTTMTDYAQARGYNMLYLLGWTCGGHDKWYPEYNPDPAMGGEQGLKDGIRLAHERGMRVIMYVNGQLIDSEGTRFWGETGEDIVVRNADGSDYHQMWQKYKDCPARHHGMACQSDLRWREIMLDLAKQMNSYGADGIIYDQLGTTNTSYCYAPNHGHSVPAIVYENDKVANLKFVADEMKKINPEFILVTEGVNEVLLNSISIFHLAAGSTASGKYFAGKNYFQRPEVVEGYINGSPKGSYFAQMTKYTIPEWTSTDRIQAPVNNRHSLNYAVLCGIRPEIECRYAPDVEYLENSRIPRDDDYDNMVSKVDITMVKSLDPVSATVYTKQINDFLLAHKDIFFNGRFVDTCGYGINTDSKAVRSSAFVNGNRMGVVVWNLSETEEANYTLSAKGWTLKETLAPDAEVKTGDALAPSSIHLAIFEK